MGNFFNGTDFTFSLRICKSVTSVKGLKKASAEIF